MLMYHEMFSTFLSQTTITVNYSFIIAITVFLALVLKPTLKRIYYITKMYLLLLTTIAVDYSFRIAITVFWPSVLKPILKRMYFLTKIYFCNKLPLQSITVFQLQSQFFTFGCISKWMYFIKTFFLQVSNYIYNGIQFCNHSVQSLVLKPLIKQMYFIKRFFFTFLPQTIIAVDYSFTITILVFVAAVLKPI